MNNTNKNKELEKKNSHLFSKDNPSKNPGPRISKLKKYLKDYDIGKKDLDLLMKNLVFSKTKTELEFIRDNEKELIIIRLFAKFVLQDYENGYSNNIEKILNRLYGLPKNIIDASINEKVNLIIDSDDAKLI